MLSTVCWSGSSQHVVVYFCFLIHVNMSSVFAAVYVNVWSCLDTTVCYINHPLTNSCVRGHTSYIVCEEMTPFTLLPWRWLNPPGPGPLVLTAPPPLSWLMMVQVHWWSWSLGQISDWNKIKSHGLGCRCWGGCVWGGLNGTEFHPELWMHEAQHCAVSTMATVSTPCV